MRKETTMKTILVALSLIFAASTIAHADWGYEKDTGGSDRVVDHYVTSDPLKSDDSFIVRISCFEDRVYDRKLSFNISEVIDHASEDKIQIKFDSEIPEWFEFSYLDDADIDTLFTHSIKDFKNLTDKMQEHSTMELMIYLFREGMHVETVDLRGFAEEFSRLPAYCQ